MTSIGPALPSHLWPQTTRRRCRPTRHRCRGRRRGTIRPCGHGLSRDDLPSWFDPSAAPPQITPFGVLYAIHDALVRPYPGHKMGPSLAKSWTESPNGKTYEFKLRPGLKFHNGDPVTTEDVKFSFERYKGASAKLLQNTLLRSRSSTARWRASISRRRGPTS
jgi:hypothetical protein